MFIKYLLCTLGLCVSLCIQSLTTPTENKHQPKTVLKDFFNSNYTLQGEFLHIISDEKIEFSSAHPEITNSGKEFSGKFTINLNKPVRFKWKYLFPYVKQIIKNDKHLFYKEGQSIKTSSDGVTVNVVNTKKPYIIYQSLPITFLFDVPVDNWIQDIQIIQAYENKDYISMEISYKILKQKGILKQLEAEKVFLVFAKKPLCLVQWCFADQNGKYNQVTLINVSINKTLTEQSLKMD